MNIKKKRRVNQTEPCYETYHNNSWDEQLVNYCDEQFINSA